MTQTKQQLKDECGELGAALALAEAENFKINHKIKIALQSLESIRDHSTDKSASLAAREAIRRMKEVVSHDK